MSKPVIGIVGSCSMSPSERFFAVEKYYVNTSYLNAVVKNGGIPMPIAILECDEDLRRVISSCDGLLIPGGEDIDPAYFNEAPHRLLGTIRPDMDSFTMRSLKIAFELKMPVFGICRGLQAINVALGGSLYQDMSLSGLDLILHNQTYDRSYAVHEIKIEENTLLHKIFGLDKTFVNTMHHQSVKALGDGLIASAYAPDGIIEAIESKYLPVFAVQWHPEELVTSAPHMNKLFSHFIGMCNFR